MSDTKALRHYLQAAALELSAELSECADDIATDATGNTDSAELIEALNMLIDSLIETAHKYTTRLEQLNAKYIRRF